MTILGIDYGTKRVGLALAQNHEAPQRLEVVENTNDLWDQLEQIITEHQVKVVVVGLPRNLDGDNTLQTGIARDFAEHLRHRTHSEVVLQDEADTSNVARQRLQHDKKLSPAERERLVDAEAAVLILEDYVRDGGIPV